MRVTRMPIPIGIGLLISFLGAVCGLSAQNQPQPSALSQSPTIQATTQEVVLDMLFRTKKGAPVRDVRREEVHIFEDGVEQKLNSFRLFGPGESPGAPSPEQKTVGKQPATAGPPLDPMREVRLVTLVTDSLDQDGKRFFAQATKDLLATTPQQNLYFSLFTIDQKLFCIQPFTSDHAALMSAVERSLKWNNTQAGAQSAQVREGLGLMVHNASEPPVSSQNGSSDFVTYTLAKLQYDILSQAEVESREYDELTSITALKTLVQEMSQLPGRKIVLYFNPWFRVPLKYQEVYENFISVANRANVSFVTVDTRGLATHAVDVDSAGARTYQRGSGGSSQQNWSDNSAGQQQLQEAIDASHRQAMSGVKGGNAAVSVDEVRSADTANSAVRADPMLWLKDLAKSTGGTAVVQTNDWKAPFRSAMDELQTYFEATYTPQIQTYDGKFRHISVKLDRPGVEVVARSGYYALPQLSGGQHLLSYELPLFNAINAGNSASSLPFHAAAERFNPRGPKLEYMITVEAPLKDMVFEPQPGKNLASVRADVLALIKDRQGAIIDKLSKEFAVQVLQEKVDSYKQGNLVQTFHTQLAPGDYTLDVAVMDFKAGRIGVSASTFHVPEPTSKLSISDVVIVRRADPLKNSEILDAFYFEGGKIVPTLSQDLKGGPGHILQFYFAVYGNPESSSAPKLTMSFYRDGQYLGAAEAPLPAPQKDGRIPYIANLPGDKFVPGSYEIRVGVLQGDEKAENKVAFRID